MGEFFPITLARFIPTKIRYYFYITYKLLLGFKSKDYDTQIVSAPLDAGGKLMMLTTRKSDHYKISNKNKFNKI